MSAGDAGSVNVGDVVMSQGQQMIQGRPAGRTILQVVEAAGFDALSSCSEGICGTCETAVLGGIPDHRDSVLGQAEREASDCVMICVSRSCTPRLILDL
jgi:ferredoxin